MTFNTFLLPLNPEQLEVDQAIASYWTKAGINIKMVPTDFSAITNS